MTWVKFSDVVKRANTKEDRFKTERLYYVGGEHIDSDDVLVHNRGLIAGSTIGPMFYFGFKAGQILFVTRNPHLRKCALVPFDGICSEKTFVLETKNEEALCQRYLAWVMQTDVFWKFCEENKSGSVNFFVNWSTLAEYEFELPPIEEQRRLADLLWAANDVKEAYKRASVASDEMLKAKFREMFGNRAVIANVWSESTLNNVFQKPITGEWGEEDIDGTGIKVLRTTNFTDEGLIDYSDTVTRKIEPDKIVNKCLKDGDIIIEKSGGSDTKAVGRVVLFHDNGQQILFNNFTSVLRANNNKYNPLYLFMFLFVLYWDGGTKLYENQTTGIHNLKLQKFLESTTIPIPPQQVQEAFARLYKKHETGKLKLKTAIANLETTIKGIINQTLEG